MFPCGASYGVVGDQLCNQVVAVLKMSQQPFAILLRSLTCRIELEAGLAVSRFARCLCRLDTSPRLHGVSVRLVGMVASACDSHPYSCPALPCPAPAYPPRRLEQ